MASDRPKYQKRQLFNSQTFMALNGRLHMSTWKFISILKFWKHFWFRYLSLKLCVFRVFHHFHHFYLVTNFRKKTWICTYVWINVDPSLLFLYSVGPLPMAERWNWRASRSKWSPGHLLLDFLIIHKVKRTKNVLICLKHLYLLVLK